MILIILVMSLIILLPCVSAVPATTPSAPANFTARPGDERIILAVGRARIRWDQTIKELPGRLPSQGGQLVIERT